ncbi:hypothetical protein [Streptomyces albidoflavus]|uniref:hypothetical protein n=1 Tax=Streptomyces albidoflavus TaxID=1886 RepID=UPI0033AA020A
MKQRTWFTMVTLSGVLVTLALGIAGAQAPAWGTAAYASSAPADGTDEIEWP